MWKTPQNLTSERIFRNPASSPLRCTTASPPFLSADPPIIWTLCWHRPTPSTQSRFEKSIYKFGCDVQGSPTGVRSRHAPPYRCIGQQLWNTEVQRLLAHLYRVLTRQRRDFTCGCRSGRNPGSLFTYKNPTPRLAVSGNLNTNGDQSAFSIKVHQVFRLSSIIPHAIASHDVRTENWPLNLAWSRATFRRAKLRTRGEFADFTASIASSILQSSSIKKSINKRSTYISLPSS